MKTHHMFEMPKASVLALAQKDAGPGAEEEEEEWSEPLDEAARDGGHEDSASDGESEPADDRETLEEAEPEESEEETAAERDEETFAEMCRAAAHALVGATRGSTGMTPPADAVADTKAPGTPAAAGAGTPANSSTHKKEYMAFVRMAKNGKRMPTSLQGEFSRDKLELFNLWLTAEKDIGKLQLLVQRKARWEKKT